MKSSLFFLYICLQANETEEPNENQRQDIMDYEETPAEFIPDTGKMLYFCAHGSREMAGKNAENQ